MKSMTSTTFTLISLIASPRTSGRSRACRAAAVALIGASLLATDALALVAQAPPATPPATPPAAAPPAAPAPRGQQPARPAPPAGGAPSRSLSTAEREQDAAPTPPRGGAVAPAESEDDLPPPIELDPPICDFGFVAPSATPTKKIKIKNTSDKPLLILASQPSCKCTTTNDISGEEIPPGGFVELEANMKAQSSPGPKKAEIKVLFDGYARVVNIQMLMEVALPVRVVPGYINAVSGQPQSGRLVIESLDKQPFSIGAIHGRPVRFVNFDPASDSPRNQYLVEYNVADFDGPEMPLFLMIETDRADCPIVDLRLRHEKTFPKPVLKMQDYRHTFGKVEMGGSGELHFEIAELGENEPVVSIASAVPGVKIEILETSKEGIMTKVRARFTTPKDFAGILYAPITIYTARRQQGMFVWGLVTPPGFKGMMGSQMVPAFGASMRFTGEGAPPAPATPVVTAPAQAPAQTPAQAAPGRTPAQTPPQAPGETPAATPAAPASDPNNLGNRPAQTPRR